MAELFGVFAHDGLAPEELAAGMRLAGEFTGFRPCTVQTVRGHSAMLSVASYHDNDHAVVGRPGEWGGIVAYVGDPRATGSPLDAAALAKCFTCRDFGPLRDAPSPFVVCAVEDDPLCAWFISDRFGLAPLYYTVCGGRIMFSTKIIPLLRSRLVRWKLDRQAVVDFFTFEHVTGDKTFADVVRLLPAATCLRFSDGRVSMHRYDDLLAYARGGKSNLCDYASPLFDRLCCASSQAIGTSQRVAVTLSGGMDSRSLLGCALELGRSPVTFTFGEEGCRDVEVASEVASACDIRHRVEAIDGRYLERWVDHSVFVGGGMVSLIHSHILALADILEQEADVVLDGFGGDALTGGHLKWTMVAGRRADAVVRFLYKQRATVLATASDRSHLFDPEFIETLAYDPIDAVRRHFAGLSPRNAWIGCHRFDLAERQRRFIQFGPHLLRPIVAVKTPFYAPDVANFLLSLPLSQLIEQRAYLRMHAAHLPRLARVPDSLRAVPLSWPVSVRFGKKVIDFLGRRLPGHAGRASKRGPLSPTDYAKWFRGDLRDFLRERLLDSPGVFDGVIRRKYVEALVQQHIEGTADNTSKLGCLLTFASWDYAVRDKTLPLADGVKTPQRPF